MTTLAAPAVATPSALVVLPAPPGRGAAPPETMVMGLPLLRRIVLAAERAGFDRVLVHPRACPEPRLLQGTRAVLLRPEALDEVPGRLVLLPAHVLPQARWLRSLREMPLDPGTPAIDPAVAVTVEGAETGRMLRSASDGLPDLIADLSRHRPHVVPVGDPAGRFTLVGADGPKAAEEWLLQSLIKDTEGFMSRHVERRISLAITRRLVGTSITPNAMTLVSLAMGLIGAPFFLSSDPLLQVAGSLLFLTHSILDGCDGELARLKFLESPTGARLDFWGDNLVHVAVFACMAIGWSVAAGAAWPLVLGALAVTGTAAAAVLVSRRSAAAPTASTARLAEAVANRDFIYLVVLLACFGRAHWFLTLVALGTPIFMLLVRWGARRRQTS
jgi:phosphatidylglycerophosphate synthase